MLGEEWDRGGSHYLPLKGVSKKKKRVSGEKICWVQLPDCWESRKEKRKSLGVLQKTGSVRSGINEPRESRWCRRTVGGSRFHGKRQL